MKKKGVVEIQKELLCLSKEFDFKYNPDWFKYALISREDNILLEYLGMCPDPAYNKFGRNPALRVKNMGKFRESFEFKECLKRFGGQVITRKSLEEISKYASVIGDTKLKNKLLALHKKINAKLQNSPAIALLTKTANKKQHYQLVTLILRHEWIHILLKMNSINFQANGKSYWKYDEGIVYYMESFLDNSLSFLEVRVKKTKYPLEKQGHIYAIKFRQLLKNKNQPPERRKVILDLTKHLE